MAQHNDTTNTLILNEFELHDLLATMVNLHVAEDNQRVQVERIKIVPKFEDQFTPALVTKWEQKVQELIDLMNRVDAEYHDDAEQTCENL